MAASIRISGGEYRGRRLRSVGGADLRPTSERVREAIFSILGPDRVNDARALDLYAGTGAMGIEALSRGAAWVDFVEADARRARRLRENLRELTTDDRGKVYQGPVERLLPRLPGGYGLVFVDPPYDTGNWETLLSQLGKGGTIEPDGVAVIEHRHTAVLSERYGALVQLTRRRYGDTGVSIYRVELVNG